MAQSFRNSAKRLAIYLACPQQNVSLSISCTTAAPARLDSQQQSRHPKQMASALKLPSWGKVSAKSIVRFKMASALLKSGSRFLMTRQSQGVETRRLQFRALQSTSSNSWNCRAVYLPSDWLKHASMVQPSENSCTQLNQDMARYTLVAVLRQVMARSWQWDWSREGLFSRYMSKYFLAMYLVVLFSSSASAVQIIEMKARERVVDPWKFLTSSRQPTRVKQDSQEIEGRLPSAFGALSKKAAPA